MNLRSNPGVMYERGPDATTCQMVSDLALDVWAYERRRCWGDPDDGIFQWRRFHTPASRRLIIGVLAWVGLALRQLMILAFANNSVTGTHSESV